MKLMDIYKGITLVKVGNCSTIKFWTDSFSGCPSSIQYPELFSFAISSQVLLSHVKEQANFADMFHQPLSTEASNQWEIVNDLVTNMQLSTSNDEWKHMKQNHKYSASQAYKQLIGHMPVHPSFK